MQNQVLTEINAKYVDLRTVLKLTTLSKSSIYVLIDEHLFPNSKKLNGTNRVVWELAKVEQYMDGDYLWIENE
jgi:predicted DNA-binding transcriptional regulator AlpA